MHSVPFESWEGAKEIFTFAHSPGVMAICLIATVVVIVGTIVASVRHENHSFAKAKNGHK